MNPFIENEIVQGKKAQTAPIKPAVPEFVICDKVILRNSTVSRENKMKAAHNTEIPTVTRTAANSMKLGGDTLTPN